MPYRESENCEKNRCTGLYVGPGFVDIHCHAGGDVWAHDDPEKMAAFHLESGTTSINCTIFHDIGEDGAIEAMKKIRSAMEKDKPGNIMGVHFEGPFLNPKYGAHAKTIRPVDKREYQRYLEEAGDIITMWTVAPEIEGAREFITDVHVQAYQSPMGHSEASLKMFLGCRQRSSHLAPISWMQPAAGFLPADGQAPGSADSMKRLCFATTSIVK